MSDKDAMGLALGRMIANLRATAAVAESIAAGDCSVEPWDSCSAEADSSWLPAETLPAADSASATIRRERQPDRDHRPAIRP
jgi:hypothetical protein